MQDSFRLLSFAALAALAVAAADSRAASMPRYEHILVIVAENRSAADIIGRADLAPELNRFASTYGVATRFYGEVHPSEGNYVAMLGGDTFGIHDDDAFYCSKESQDPFCRKAGSSEYADHTIRAPSLMDQLEAHHLTWKAYLQSLPAPGSRAVFWPAPGEAVADEPTGLYASKHNGFINFERVQHDPALASKLVGFAELDKDIDSGQLPNYAHIVPNQCNDMHGLATLPGIEPDCNGEPGLTRRGDRFIGELTQRIMHSPAWDSPQNFAIVITFDEGKRGEGEQGCCGYEPGSPANFGGGRIATIVITNHGPRGVKDDTPYNHYSLLRTTEAAFGIREHLAHAGDDRKGVRTMTPLFAVRR